MQLNVTTDYAIRIVLYLAIKKEITTSKEIGAAMGIPKNYVLKITHKLEEDKFCSRYATENCPVRGFYCKLQEELEKSLKKMTIKRLLADAN